MAASSERNVYHTSSRPLLKKKKPYAAPIPAPSLPAPSPRTSSQASPPPSSSPPTGLFCKYCKRTNHVVEDCFRLKKIHPESSSRNLKEVGRTESEFIPSSFNYNVFLSKSTLQYNDRNLVLLDTCAQVSIFTTATC
jgi:hypothetical protein